MNAFLKCSSLKEVSFAGSLDEVESCAFAQCPELKAVTVEGDILNIGKYAFGYANTYADTRPEEAEKIEGFTIYGHKGTEIEKYANDNGFTFVDLDDPSADFEYTVSDGKATITKYNGTESALVIPSEIGGYPVTGIGEYAFAGCTSIESINIPDSVTSIGKYAFAACSSLKSITVDQNNPVYDSRENCNAVIHTKSNELVVGCVNTVIPDSVKSIGRASFYGCTSLTSIDIPGSVTSIGPAAFYGCTAMKSVTVPASVTSIGNYALGYYSEGDNKVKIEGFTICGSKNTAAEKYAKDNGFTFIESKPSYLIGDADSDGKVSVIDATQIQKKLAQLPVLPGFNEDAARVDGSATLHILDATYIQKWLAKIAVPYPIGEPAA